MIYLIVGENTYQAAAELRRLTKDAVEVERLDGVQLSDSTLSDSMRGATLFSAQRTIVVRDLSERQDLLEKFIAWAGDVPADTTIILVEQKLDKRTKAYKALLKVATVIAVDYWSNRDTRLAEEWLRQLAGAAGITLSGSQVQNMVQRAFLPTERAGQYFIDQSQLAQAVAALRVLDTATDDSIAAVLPPAPGETVFALLEYAIQRDHKEVQLILQQLHLSEDPYRAFGAIAKQWSQLVAVAMARDSAAELSIHPYVLGKLRQQARSITRQQISELTNLAADLDARMKISEVTPWEAVDRFIMALTLR